MTVGMHDDDKAEGPLMMNKKIRRVNFLYHDEENSPVEFLAVAYSGYRDKRLSPLTSSGCQGSSTVLPCVC